MNKKQLFNIAKIVVSIVLLLFIFYTLNIELFFKVVQQANPWWLLAALATIIGGVVMRSWRWHILLDAIGVRVPLSELIQIYFIGFLFNNLLPSGLGGDAIRMVELNRHTERGSDTVTSVLVDRFVGLSALQAIAIIALIVDWSAVPMAVALFTVIVFIGGLTAILLLINHRLYTMLQANFGLFRKIISIKFIGNMFESFQRYSLGALGRAYLVSLLFNLMLILANFFIGTGLGADVKLTQYAIIVPITSMVLLIPISFAGLGVREEAYRQLYGQLGVPAEVAVAMSLIYYVFGNVCNGIIGGVIYLIRNTRDAVSQQQ